jgi:serine protease AprX
MRLTRATGGDRSNALWGRGSRGESRSNALWGRGGRRAGAVMATVVATCALTATAVAGNGSASASSGPKNLKAYVPDSLVSAIEQDSSQTFDVIVQGDKKGNSTGLYEQLLSGGSGDATASEIKQQFQSIDGVHALLTGRQILSLAKRPYVTSVTPNESVAASGYFAYFNYQKWAWAVGAEADWTWGSPRTPTIAIMDSGIDTSQWEFAGRVLGQVDMVTGDGQNSPGDGYGHGTFVAGIAAGAAWGYAGVAPRANLFSVDVLDDTGAGTVSDIIAGCDWVLQHKDTYNIRVVNMSFHAANRASVLFDPLDQAAEKLWLNGLVVVTAAGNYGVDGQQGEVSFAPGNDPFVITVGAADINNSLGSSDDFAAPWSAYGYTADGFAKPDLGAPGRYMIAAVPPSARMYVQRPGNVSSFGHMQLSGTSFAAPAVAGAAAEILAEHPDWTPDQVKGALMLSASPTPAAAPLSLGVGELNVPAAEAVQQPPNPNADLTPFVTVAADGTKVFDSAAWQSAALSSAAWASAAWSDAAWASAAWSSAAWASAAWASAAWASAAWGSAAWSDAAWADAAWADAAWADNADDPAIGDAAVQADPSAEDAVLAELGISCDPTLTTCVTTTSSG